MVMVVMVVVMVAVMVAVMVVVMAMGMVMMPAVMMTSSQPKTTAELLTKAMRIKTTIHMEMVANDENGIGESSGN